MSVGSVAGSGAYFAKSFHRLPFDVRFLVALMRAGIAAVAAGPISPKVTAAFSSAGVRGGWCLCGNGSPEPDKVRPRSVSSAGRLTSNLSVNLTWLMHLRVATSAARR